MAEPDFYLCDFCGEPLPQKLRIHATTGYSTDECGDTDPDQTRMDLCSKHLKEALDELLLDGESNRMVRRRADTDKGKQLVKWFENQKRIIKRGGA